MLEMLFLMELMLLTYLIKKAKITGKTNNGGNIENVEIMEMLLKCLELIVKSNLFWPGLKINQNPTFTITETNLYVPVVPLSTQDNAKLLPQSKSSFKRTISWNKYLVKPELLAQNANLSHLIRPSFQGINRLFVLAFEDDDQRISEKNIIFQMYK